MNYLLIMCKTQSYSSLSMVLSMALSKISWDDIVLLLCLYQSYCMLRWYSTLFMALSKILYLGMICIVLLLGFTRIAPSRSFVRPSLLSGKGLVPRSSRLALQAVWIFGFLYFVDFQAAAIARLVFRIFYIPSSLLWFIKLPVGDVICMGTQQISRTLAIVIVL